MTSVVYTNGSGHASHALPIFERAVHPLRRTPIQRILLVTDGTVTEILEAYTGESMRLIKLYEELVTLDEDLPGLELAAGQQVLRRKILLQGKMTLTNFLYADSSVALDRLERRGAPLALVPGGDDVVMRIEQDRGRSRRPGKLAPDDRSGIGKMKGVELLHPCVTEELDHEVVRLEERSSCLLRKVRSRHRRNRHQPGQVGLQRWHQR